MSVSEVDIKSLVTISEFARSIRRSYGTVLAWHNNGRWNKSRTRLVFLQCLQGPQGLSLNDELYERFIDDLNTL